MRPTNRSRCALPGGYPSRSGERNVATARLFACRSARYDRLGSAASKPCTTSKRPDSSASSRFVRAPTGTTTRLRREIGTAGPSAISCPSPAEPARSAARPAARSAARFEEARIVTACPSARSSWATPATCSLTSCGFDQANGVTRQMRSAIGVPRLAQRRQRIDGGAPDAHLEMQMRPHRFTRGADASDLEARSDALAEPYLDARQMRVQRADTVAVRDRDELAPAAVAPGRPDDAARTGGGDARPGGRR